MNLPKTGYFQGILATGIVSLFASLPTANAAVIVKPLATSADLSATDTFNFVNNGDGTGKLTTTSSNPKGLFELFQPTGGSGQFDFETLTGTTSTKAFVETSGNFRIDHQLIDSGTVAVVDSSGTNVLTANFTNGDLQFYENFAFLTFQPIAGQGTPPVTLSFVGSPTVNVANTIPYEVQFVINHQPASPSSIAADGLVNSFSFAGGTTFDVTPTPEPASLGVLAIGAIALAARRRKA